MNRLRIGHLHHAQAENRYHMKNHMLVSNPPENQASATRKAM